MYRAIWARRAQRRKNAHIQITRTPRPFKLSAPSMSWTKSWLLTNASRWKTDLVRVSRLLVWRRPRAKLNLRKKPYLWACLKMQPWFKAKVTTRMEQKVTAPPITRCTRVAAPPIIRRTIVAASPIILCMRARSSQTCPLKWRWEIQLWILNQRPTRTSWHNLSTTNLLLSWKKNRLKRQITVAW